jgi:hydroxymethylbilane synthase
LADSSVSGADFIAVQSPLKNASVIIRVGTRGSALAMAQARLVAGAVERACPPCRAELLPIATRGDRLAGPLDAAGGKGLFTAELEDALRAGRIQLAVHSAKDLPAEMPAGLLLAGVPAREDPRDAIVSRPGGGLAGLHAGAIVGTSSPRRAAQLRALRPDVKIVPIRGNVETRVRKLMDGGPAGERLDAIILAMAGLKRSGLLEEHGGRVQPFAEEDFVPAAGQGALAVQSAEVDARSRAVAAKITDAASLAALQAERCIVRALGADCRSCLAVHVRADAAAGAQWQALAMAARPDGAGLIRSAASGPSAASAARTLLEDLRSRGAEELLKQ